MLMIKLKEEEAKIIKIAERNEIVKKVYLTSISENCFSSINLINHHYLLTHP